MKFKIRPGLLADMILILAAIVLLIVPTINGLSTPVIVSSEGNLSIDLGPDYVIVDANASSIAKITSQGMTHAYNITNTSIPKAGNAVVAVLSVGDSKMGSNIDKYALNFEDMISSLLRLGAGKQIGERNVTDIKGQNVTVMTFEVNPDEPNYIKLFGKEFDFALWSIDNLNIGYITVPSSLGRNVTERIIGTLKI